MKKLLLFLLIPVVIFAQKQPKVGLVLSGGGAKGLAHIAVLKELEKSGVQLDYIGGTSMGAIVGGLYASGYTADQIKEIVLTTDFMQMVVDKIPRREMPFFNKEHDEKYAISLPIKNKKIGLPLGVSKGQNVLNFLTELLAPVDDIKSFSNLPIPFFCIATNIETGAQEVLESGSLPLALRASGAFPSLLNPVEIDGKLLIDGGVVNNFPVDIMKEKVDFVIGVSVQGKLLEKQELASAASLLMQIINFQMYKKSDEQVALLDVYLQPSLLEYNVISFDKTAEILKEGTKTVKPFKAVFDSIAKFQVIKRKAPVRNLKKRKFLVDRIIIKGNKNYTNDYILGKLQLEKGDSVSYQGISRKINTLTATNNFRRIDYHLTKSFSGKKLMITVKEEPIQSYLRFGLHYDVLYKSAVLLNYNHKKFLKQNDELSLDIAIGDRVRYNFEYFIDNGITPSYGFSSSHNSFKSEFLFDNSLINIKYNDFTNALYLKTTIDKKFAFGTGIEHKWLQASSENILTNGKQSFFDKSNYVNLYAFLKLDTYNKVMFPTEGFYADFGFKWFTWSDRNNRLNRLEANSNPFHQFSQANATIGFATTFLQKMTFQYTSDIGYTLGKKNSEMFDYRLGGYNQNFINNFTPLYGYASGALSNQSFLKSEFNIRYEILNKHYVSFIANYARVEEDILSGGYFFDNTKSGYALGYSVETFLGPIELKYTWSPDHKQRHWLFNLGFWF
ncbi:patatin-like phospholipase family protein [Tenacibaculum piscium]|uniref:patatin-like phospholipase family protein n=1 Tax=Tenacibaculum piscium TaxID=1458515 RepID=UPI001EFB1C3E|nr:patatin-like phospholipase family protein [Tenacibaculum piscium]MCG8183207.1 patatin-like phospholipase family protein [Tenacibaculum piscium]MCG8204609.1 patatin-like phospholipase family protein [Tenacibaculum piscium]